MSLSFKLNTKGIALFDPKKSNAKTLKLTKSYLVKVLPVLSAKIKMQAPVGATGELRNNVNTEISSPLRGRVYSGTSYAVVIEKGRRAAPVAESANPSLIRWLRSTRKGRAMLVNVRKMMSKGSYRPTPDAVLRSALFLLKRSMKRKKRKANPFFKRGTAESQSFIDKSNQDFINTLAKELSLP